MLISRSMWLVLCFRLVHGLCVLSFSQLGSFYTIFDRLLLLYVFQFPSCRFRPFRICLAGNAAFAWHN